MKEKLVSISSITTFLISFGCGWYSYSVNSFWGFLFLAYLSYVAALLVGSVFDGSFGGGSNGDRYGGSGGHLDE